MIDWVGGEQNLVGIIIPLSGICILLIIPKITETNRSRRYFLPAFIFWLGFQLLIGLEQGTLISFPHPIGLLSAGFLLHRVFHIDDFWALCCMARARPIHIFGMRHSTIVTVRVPTALYAADITT